MQATAAELLRAIRSERCAAPPSRLLQRWAVARALAQYEAAGLQHGDTYAVVPTAWWRAWSAHVGGFSHEVDIVPALSLLEAGKTLDLTCDDAAVVRTWSPATDATMMAATDAPGPGAIDTVGLLDIAESVFVARAESLRLARAGGELGEAAAGAGNAPPTPDLLAAVTFASPMIRRGLAPDVDFTTIGSVAFDLLRTWYGSCGPALLRLVVNAALEVCDDDYGVDDGSTADDDDGEEDEEAGAGGKEGGAGRKSPLGGRARLVLYPRAQRRLWRQQRAAIAPADSFGQSSVPLPLPGAGMDGSGEAQLLQPPAAGSAGVGNGHGPQPLSVVAAAANAPPGHAQAPAAATVHAARPIGGSAAPPASSGPRPAAGRVGAPAAPAPTLCSYCCAAAPLQCSFCRSEYYCSQQCQRSHWLDGHRAACATATAKARAAAAAAAGATISSSAADEASALLSSANGSGAAQQRQQHPSPSHNGIVGLTNLGNTCFMASSLQSLSVAWPLTQYMLSNSWKKDVNKGNRDGTGGTLARAYSELLRKMWFAPRGTVAVDPSDVKRAVVRFQERFTGFAQQDAGELMQFLLDGLSEDLNRVAVKPYVAEADEFGERPDADAAAAAWARYLARNRSIVTSLFAGQFKSRVVCPTCARPSLRFDPFTALVLPVPSAGDAVRRHFLVRITRVPLAAAASTTASAAASAARSDGELPLRLARLVAAANSGDAAAVDAAVAAAAPTAVAAPGGGKGAGGKGSAKASPTKQPAAAPVAAAVVAAEDVAAVAAIDADCESDYRARRWQLVGATVRRADDVAALRRAVAAAGGVPAADVLLIVSVQPTGKNVWPADEPPEVMVLPDGIPLERIFGPPHSAGDVNMAVHAFLLPPIGSGGRATAAVDSDSDAAAPAAAGPPAAASDVLVTVLLHNITRSPHDASQEPDKPITGFSADNVVRSGSVYHGPPTALVLPRSAGMAQLRLAAARAVAPMLAGGWAAARAALLGRAAAAAADGSTQPLPPMAHGAPSPLPATQQQQRDAVCDDDALALALLAATLPLVHMSFGSGITGDDSNDDADDDARPSFTWLPLLPAAGEADATLDGILAASPLLPPPSRGKRAGKAVSPVAVHIAVAWRTQQWVRRFDPQRALAFASGESPSVTAMQAARALDRDAASRAGTGGVPLSACFSRFSEPEVLDTDNAFYCSKCAAHVCATKTIELWAAPRLLVLVLKRFRGMRGGKIEARVDFPLEGLDLTALAAGGRSLPCPAGAEPAAAAAPPPPSAAATAAPSPLLYDCFAVVNHFGSMAFGHYTAFVNHAVARYGAEGGSGAPPWYHCDDRKVERVDDPLDVVSKAAYILLYRRRDE